MEVALLNLSYCILFNITWASFPIYIAHSKVDEYRGPFYLRSHLFVVDGNICVGEGGYAYVVT